MPDNDLAQNPEVPASGRKTRETFKTSKLLVETSETVTRRQPDLLTVGDAHLVSIRALAAEWGLSMKGARIACARLGMVLVSIGVRDYLVLSELEERLLRYAGSSVTRAKARGDRYAALTRRSMRAWLKRVASTKPAANRAAKPRKRKRAGKRARKPHKKP